MSRPLILDLFCGQGGAAKGYHDAGFEVVGVDIVPQPRYPYEFVQADALRAVVTLAHEFDAIHASPPCQHYTKAQRIRDYAHADLVRYTRKAMEAYDVPWIIENVPGAPLSHPITLCGTMFGLRLYRHRLFETSWPLSQPDHPKHVAPQVKMGRKPKPHEFLQPVGNFSGAEEARVAMEMPWASRDGLREAIPPAYTRWIGGQLMVVLP